MPSSSRRVFHTSRAPQAIGPYSQAVIWQGLIFVSGMGPLDPATKEVVRTSFADQVRRTLDNLQAVLEDAGSSLGNVLKTGVFLKDIGNFKEFNAIYATYFTAEPPARTTVEAARLPLDIEIEVDAIACLDDSA
jgi:2-iminobutanoate/2-iminopropanoate deaminase